SRFNPVELRRSHYVLLLGGKNFTDLVLRFLNPVWSLGMRIEGLRQCPRLLLLHGLNLFEERYEGRRIIPSAIHVLDAEIIRFRFEATGEVQEGQRNAEPHSLINS